MAFPPLEMTKRGLRLLDQRLLPEREKWILCTTSRQVHQAIRIMVVRGAPAIGIAAGYGLYLGLRGFRGNVEGARRRLRREADYLKTSRPTGVNLRNVLERLVEASRKKEFHTSEALKAFVLREAERLHREDDRLCRKIGRAGAALIPKKARILTHCNAGGLATTGYGTALGVIYAARAAGRKIFVYADETRPLLQGARLTAWELVKSRIPCSVLCDNMAASLMAKGLIDCVIVGADRIAANGDTANKIGTYGVAVLARAHGLPFYVAAPGTTFDFSLRSGKGIPIEDRGDEEVSRGFGVRTAPRRAGVVNPAFDVTPARLISAIITEAGVLKPPFTVSIRRFRNQLEKSGA